MRILYALLLFMSIVIFFSCDDENTEWRGEFYWNGQLGNESGRFTIRCDTTCDSCAAYTDRGALKFNKLAKNTYKAVYNKCLSLPSHKGWVTIDTNDRTPVPTGKVEFSSATGTRFGFDSWLENSRIYQRESYISMATDDSTDFAIKIDKSNYRIYNSIIAVLPRAAHGVISFSKDSILDTIRLLDTLCNVRIYSGSTVDTSWGKYINVYGIVDPKEPACLAGDCFGSEDKIKVFVYETKIWDNFKIYLVNSTSFNPDSASLAKGFNDIIKQGVIKIGKINIQKINDWSWDKNGNKTFDDFASYTDVPVNYIEYFDLLQAVNEYGKGCDANRYPAAIIVKDKIRYHWVLDQDVAAGKDYISLNTVEGLKKGTDQLLMNWFGESSQSEWIHIKSIDQTANLIYLSNALKYSHKKNESIYDENTELGFTFNSCSCISDNPDYKILTHEFLHDFIIGNLKHVDNDDNIMFSAHNTMKDTKLRYRTLYGEKGIQNQWRSLKR